MVKIMSTPEQPPTQRRSSLNQLLIQNTNARGEVSPGLEHALALAGRKARAVLLPAEDLATHSLGNATGILIVGPKFSAVWCSAGTLHRVAALAKTYGARHALNWDGAMEVNLKKSPKAPAPEIEVE